MKAVASTPRWVMSSIALGAAVACVAAVAVGALPLAVPASPSVRQEGGTPDTVLPTATLLANHCDGTPISGDVATAVNSSGTWEGNCTLVLAIPGGELSWSAGSTATISGALSIRLSAALPPGAEYDGEVEWGAGATTTAASLAVAAADINVEEGATLLATTGGVDLSAVGDLDVGPAANVTAPAGAVTLAATADVDLDAGSVLTAGAGNVSVAAGADLDAEAGAAVSASGGVALSAAVAANLQGPTLTAGGAVVVAAPDCLAVGVVANAPTTDVC